MNCLSTALSLSCPLFHTYSYCLLLSHRPGPSFHWRITHSIFLCVFLLKHLEMEGKGWLRSFQACPNGCNYTRKYYRGCVWSISALPQDHNRKTWPPLHLYVSMCSLMCHFAISSPSQQAFSFLTGAPVLKLPFPFPYHVSCRMSGNLFSRNIL